jgi:hypothetical protein
MSLAFYPRLFQTHLDSPPASRSHVFRAVSSYPVFNNHHRLAAIDAGPECGFFGRNLFSQKNSK